MIFTSVSEPIHLEEILALQKANLRIGRSEKDIQREGFVTCEHTLELLSDMNTPYPHIIALHYNRVVGYALVMLPQMRDRLEILKPMFEKIDQVYLKSKDTAPTPYFVMGQICIDKAFRGQGLFYGLYEHMKVKMSPYYRICITEVSSLNKRSLKAHKNQGFQEIHKYKAQDGHPWEIIAWNWD